MISRFYTLQLFLKEGTHKTPLTVEPFEEMERLKKNNDASALREKESAAASLRVNILLELHSNAPLIVL